MVSCVQISAGAVVSIEEERIKVSAERSTCGVIEFCQEGYKIRFEFNW